MRIFLTILWVVIVSLLLLSANTFLVKIDVNFVDNKFINNLFKYQLLALVIATITFFISWKFTPESKFLLTVGNIDTLAIKESWMGINGKSSWIRNGIQLLFFISLATGIFMFLAVKYTNNLPNFKFYFIPWIVIFALLNSFSEEIIFRLAVNGNLMNYIPKLRVLLISAILFGLPHYQGYPNGIMGVIMAGVLGYVLSKATYETEGIGIAWTIHFVQDLIIFTALLMMN
ncbi:MAG: CPBP family intramembrane metalloprotease [Arcicella sp.]|jgi:hypothetical protein|nr:CPBP family intramembrane metalloprotease [Arcicella sp.]